MTESDTHTPESEVSEPATMEETLRASNPGLPEEVLDKLEALKTEFGEANLTELMVDVHLDEDIADFVLAAESRLRAQNQALNGKARFLMHREPNADLYILRNLKPSEWNTAWLQILAGQEEAFDRHADAILTACMVYPQFDETDWDYEGGGKLNAPLGMTKSRLVGQFFDNELTDPNQPSSVAFTEANLDNAAKVARRHKPSL